MAATGWTYEYIEEWLTIPRLNELLRHWADYPPVHISVALFTGVQSERTQARASAMREAANEQITNADVVRDMPVRASAIQWRRVENG